MRYVWLVVVCFWLRCAPASPQLADVQAITSDTRFRVALAAGSVLRLRAEQQGVDGVLRVTTPSGRFLEVDGPTALTGDERLVFITEEKGVHRIDVRLTGHGISPNKVVLYAEVADSPSRSDRALAQAFVLRNQALTDRSLSLWEEAVSLCRAAGDERQAAIFRAESADLRSGAAQFETLDLLVSQESWPYAIWLALRLARYQRLDGDFMSAELAYRHVWDLAVNSGDPFWRMRSANAIGVFYYFAGRHHEAISYYLQSLHGAHQLGLLNFEALCQENLATAYNALGLHQEALDAAESGLALDNSRAGLHTQVAWSAHFLKRDVRAETHFATALRLLRDREDQLGIGGVLDRRGVFYRERGLWEEATADFTASLRIFESLDALDGRAHSLSNQAQLHFAKGDVATAEQLAQRALALFDQSINRLGRAKVLLVLSQIAALRRPEDLTTALELSAQALDLVQDVHETTERRMLARSFGDTRREYFAHQVQLLMKAHMRAPDQGFARQALAVVDRHRALSLYHALSDPAVTEEARRLMRSLSAIDQRWRGMGDARQPSWRRRRDFRSMILALDEARTVTAVSPSDVLNEQPEVLLGQDDLLLVLFLDSPNSFLWEVSRDHVEAHLLPDRKTLEPLARFLNAELSRSRELMSGQGRALRDRLRDQVLGPIKDRVAKRLLIVPDGDFHYLSFELLWSDPGDDRLQAPVVYMPSGAVGRQLIQVSNQREQAPKLAAIFADPVTEIGDDRLSDHSSAAGMRRDVPAEEGGLGFFPRLTHSGVEARDIRRLLGEGRVDQWSGFEANRERLLGLSLEDYRILHFATHAVNHPDHTELSGLVLSVFDETGRRQDPLIRDGELQAMDFRADLIVLSACESGYGAPNGLQGPWGLPHSLLSAGALRVLVSFQKVDDAATAYFMARFYHHLTRLSDPPLALAEAKSDMRAHPTWRAPHFWSHFFLLGHPGPMSPLLE